MANETQTEAVKKVKAEPEPKYATAEQLNSVVDNINKLVGVIGELQKTVAKAATPEEKKVEKAIQDAAQKPA